MSVNLKGINFIQKRANIKFQLFEEVFSVENSFSGVENESCQTRRNKISCEFEKFEALQYKFWCSLIDRSSVGEKIKSKFLRINLNCR